MRTYPISTGKMDWKTPLGVTRIVTKEHMPNWYPPESVRLEHEQRGDPLPKVVPPGPDNPLGEHKMRLAIPGGAYLIHGTNRPAGVGMQVTHGCIRMYPEDIAELFALVTVNTKVNLIDQTTKVGWSRGTLYVERHGAARRRDGSGPRATRLRLTRLIEAATSGKRATVEIDWNGAQQAFAAGDGGARLRCPYLSARPLRRADDRARDRRPGPDERQKKTPRQAAASSFARCEIESGDYLPIDFWNARSIFSFVASQQACAP